MIFSRYIREGGFPDGLVVKAFLVVLRALFFPAPIRAGVMISLRRANGRADTLKLLVGPWPGNSDRAMINLIMERDDWTFWIDNLDKALKSGKGGTRLSREEKKRRRALLEEFGGGKYGFTKPTLGQSIKILHEMKGGYHINMTDDQGKEHHIYLVHNHVSATPPGDLLTMEISQDVFDRLVSGGLDFSTAFIQKGVSIHGNYEAFAKLTQLSGGPAAPTYKPKVYIDRTDHPLDKGFGVEIPMPPLTASCILRLDSMKQHGADVSFAARGYDVYRTRILNMLHDYDASDDISFDRLTLKISWLKPNVFRVRCAKGDSTPDNITPMLDGPLPAPDFEPACVEHEDHFEVKSPELKLLVYKTDFRIEVVGPGGEVTVMAKDAGSQADPAALPEGMTGAMELEIADPVNGHKAWAYLGRFEGQAPRSSTDYVKVELLKTKRWRFSGEDFALEIPDGYIVADYLALRKKDGTMGPDVLDREKLRMEILVKAINYSFNIRGDSLIRAEVRGWIDGPVRVIHYNEGYVQDGPSPPGPGQAGEIREWRGLGKTRRQDRPHPPLLRGDHGRQVRDPMEKRPDFRPRRPKTDGQIFLRR